MLIVYCYYKFKLTATEGLHMLITDVRVRLSVSCN